MNKIFNFLVLSFFVLLISMVSGCVSLPSQIPETINENSRVGLVAFIPPPVFTTYLTKGYIKDKDDFLIGYSHYISDFDLQASIENSIFPSIIKIRNLNIIPLHYDCKNNIRDFVKKSILENHLDYLVVLKPSIYIESHRHFDVRVFGYGILYASHVGLFKVYPVSKGYAGFYITVLDHNLLKKAARSINLDKEFRQSNWKPQFNQLNSDDIDDFKLWIQTDVLPAIKDSIFRILKLNNQ